MSGKQVRLYLVDGSPGGLLTAEIMNWTGHLIASPRSGIADLLKREEARRTGVYLLLGDDPEAPGGTAVYVGEGDEIATRLRQHSRPSDQGGKDFWDRVVILTSKDANLTKAHARYLESQLIAAAHTGGRASVLNGTAPPLIQLPEADISDMEYYLSQVHIILPVLGITAFRASRYLAVQTPVNNAEGGQLALRISPRFTLRVPRHAIEAFAREVDGEFTVLQGSKARAAWIGTDLQHPGYKDLHEKLVSDGGLERTADGNASFTRDVVFPSPSAAAAVVTGRAANGRTSWIDVDGGQDFGTWQARGVVDLTGDV